MKYVALLRGINVGGHKLIKMDMLRGLLASAGFRNVRTLIASGNVLFEAPKTRPSTLARRIEKILFAGLGYEVPVIVRTVDDLKALVKKDPFKKVEATKDVMLFVAFLFSEPRQAPKLPLKFFDEHLEVLAIVDGAAFILARRKKTGWFSFPSNFIEKLLGVAATTRNWTTVRKMANDGARET